MSNTEIHPILTHVIELSFRLPNSTLDFNKTIIGRGRYMEEVIANWQTSLDTEVVGIHIHRHHYIPDTNSTDVVSL